MASMTNINHHACCALTIMISIQMHIIKDTKEPNSSFSNRRPHEAGGGHPGNLRLDIGRALVLFRLRPSAQPAEPLAMVASAVVVHNDLDAARQSVQPRSELTSIGAIRKALYEHTQAWSIVVRRIARPAALPRLPRRAARVQIIVCVVRGF